VTAAACWCCCLQSHGKLAAALSGLAREVQGDPQLAARIRAKYKIKNTVSPAAACFMNTTTSSRPAHKGAASSLVRGWVS
jgi:hypothetical protein